MPTARSRPHRWILVILAVLSVAVGCKSGAKAPETLQPVTEAEAQAFAESLEAAFATCDEAKLKASIDIEAAMRVAIRKSTVPKRQQNTVLRGMVEGAEGRSFLTEFCGLGEDNAIARFLRLRKADGRTSALFRLSSSQGINYIEFYLGKSKDGRVLSDNFYVFLTGTDLVETFRAPIDALIANPKRAKEFANVIALLQTDPERGLAQLGTLPKKVRNTKAVQISAVLAASEVSDDAYEKAIADYEAHFPGDASLDLVSVDRLILTGKHDEAMAAVNRLDKSLGGDPYLAQLRAGIAIEQGTDFASAANYAKEAIGSEPADTDNYFLWLQAELGSKSVSGTAEALEAIAKNFDLYYEANDMTELTAAFPAFLESAEWLAYKVAYLTQATEE